jgi:hypothetical protein
VYPFNREKGKSQSRAQSEPFVIAILALHTIEIKKIKLARLLTNIFAFLIMTRLQIILNNIFTIKNK